ncbi:MAG: DUF2795 domain-containing protein [Sphingomonadaceae bacterium]
MEEKRTTTSPVDVAEALEGAPFPCSKQRLLDYARAKGASEEALETLLFLPEATYEDASEVMRWVRG